MSNDLTDFLTDLSKDSDLMDAYVKDRAGTMRSRGVTQENIDLVINENYEEIKKMIGADEEMSTHSIIHLTKK